MRKHDVSLIRLLSFRTALKYNPGFIRSDRAIVHLAVLEIVDLPTLQSFLRL